MFTKNLFFSAALCFASQSALANTKLYVVTYKEDGIPTGICVKIAASCALLNTEDADFQSYENGWAVTYNYPDVNSPDFEKSQGIAEALARFIEYQKRSENINCDNPVTTPNNPSQVKLVCSFKHKSTSM